jgi:hypothetical protein
LIGDVVIARMTSLRIIEKFTPLTYVNDMSRGIPQLAE